MSFEVYRLIHFLSLITVTSCMGVSYFCKPAQKWAKIVGMTASLLLLVAGMGMLARTMSGQPWPTWIKIKIGLWLTIATLGPIMAKRLTKNRGLAFSFLMVLFSMAILLAVYKPSF